MKKLLAIGIMAIVVALGFPSAAFAQSGHFLTGGGNAPRCTDTGLTVTCTGKVAGLGGTTFEIQVAANGIASVECTNPGGNVAPGQDTAVAVAGSSGPLPTPRNGQYRFSVMTNQPPPVPNYPTCPNPQWTANIVDVSFTTATLTLFENGLLSDQVTVTVS